MASSISIPVDSYVESLKAARKGPAVLKIKLVNFRSLDPDMFVFAFEGDDDKIVYFHWIKQIRPDLNYEPFPCDGKSQVLGLKEILDRDLSGIGRGVYYFVDRDFDDLKGRPASEDIFMTDQYSVENYLVTANVLEELLKNELHCHGEIACRHRILQLFEDVYSQYIEITKPLNFRLFLARKLAIKTQLFDKPNRLAKIELDNVRSSDFDINDIIKLEREPTELEAQALRNDFDELIGSQRYRGKFSFTFFKKWIELLAADRNNDQPIHFSRIDNNSKVQYHHLNLDSYATKAAAPQGLGDFISAVAW